MADQPSPETRRIIVRNANQKAAEAAAKGDNAKAKEWQDYADRTRKGGRLW